MKINIRLFAAARAALDQESVILELPVGGTVGDVCEQLAQSHPELIPILAHSRIALNHDYATHETPVPEDAELALIPPVSGG